jgi:putative oxidoreductase
MVTMTLKEKIVRTDSSAALIFVRCAVGAVFLSEGAQKFLFPNELGVGRFSRIGIPAPGFLAPFDGAFEILCGLLFLCGLFTRLAAVPMIINMLVAISSTKIPILVKQGFWAMAHESRTDYVMLLGSIYLLMVGSGCWSLDRLLFMRKESGEIDTG